MRKVEGKKMEMVVFIVYCVLSYWAVGQTIYANKIQIGSIRIYTNAPVRQIMHGRGIGSLIIFVSTRILMVILTRFRVIQTIMMSI